MKKYIIISRGNFMKFEKNRYLLIMKELSDRNVAVTSEELARKAMVSVRTIKSDISYLNSITENDGSAKIVSIKAKGYILKALDDDRYKKLCSDINIQYTLFQSRSIERTNRELYILQSLLSEKYVKLETICDTLFLSRSAIAEDISWTKNFLFSYNLKMISIPGKGLHVEGLEQDLRSVMVEVFCSQYHDIELLYPVERFSKYFYDDRQIYEDIRHALLKALRESKVSVRDLDSKKLATHLCLIKSRSAAGKHPELPKAMIKELKSSYEYKLATEIINLPIIKEYVGKINEGEILNFARLIIVNRDIDLHSTNDLETLSTDLIIQNQKIYAEIVEELKKGTGGKLFTMDLFRFFSGDLESLQMGLYLKHRYGSTSKQRIVTYNEGVENQVSPLSLELSRLMIRKTEERFGEKICGVENKSYAAAFDYLIDHVDYSYKKLRLATTSTDGKIIAELMREDLNRHYRDYIETNDIFELYEMRKIEFDDYDAVVISWGSLYLTYPLPFIRYDYPHTDKNRQDNMFKELFLRGYSRKRLEEIKQIVNCYENVEIKDYVSFIQALSFKYGDDDANQKNIFEETMMRAEILSYYYNNSGISLLFFDYAATGKEFIDVYRTDKPLYWNHFMEINYVVTVSLNPALPTQDLKLTDRMLQILVRDRFIVGQLYKDKNTVIDKMFCEEMEENFIK
jgi:hypothetical protein